MNTQLLNAIKRKALDQRSAREARSNTAPLAPTVATVPPTPAPVSFLDILDRVEIVANKKRLDLYFSTVPSESQRDQLKAAGWWYNPTDRSWYHADRLENREWIARWIGVSLESYPAPTVAPVVTPAPTVAPVVTPAPTVAPVVTPAPTVAPVVTPAPTVADELSRYRSQVDELIGHLKICPADLQLLAIDRLHKAEFSRDA
jgi:hypothetical protein